MVKCFTVFLKNKNIIFKIRRSKVTDYAGLSDPWLRTPGQNSVQTYWKLSESKTLTTTVKPVLSGHSKRTQKMFFKTDYRLMQVKSIAECSKGSILQYFRPSLSYHFPLRPLLCIFLSDRLRQVLLYL